MQRMLALLLLAIALACASPHVQRADSAFDAAVARPEFIARGARVLFDDAHRNFHTSDGRYAPFVTLLRNDGLEVVSNRVPFTLETLESWDVLVIVNARGEPPPANAFQPAEIDAVAEWVARGGGLLLVADHTPFGLAASALGERFGVTMLDANLRDMVHNDPSLPGPYFLLFTRENGLIREHPITEGRRPEERVSRVVTFGGQALRAPAGAAVVLDLAPSAEIVDRTEDPPRTQPAAGAVHMIALDHGQGRVVILGEAAALTAQVITGEVAEGMGLAELRLGMSHPGIDNKQLALNTLRWLVGRM